MRGRVGPPGRQSGIVQISVDGGQTWTSLGNEDTTDELDAGAYPILVNSLPGFDGSSGGRPSPSSGCGTGGTECGSLRGKRGRMQQLLEHKASTVAAIVTYDESMESILDYAPYSLKVNGFVQPGGSYGRPTDSERPEGPSDRALLVSGASVLVLARVSRVPTLLSHGRV